MCGFPQFFYEPEIATRLKVADINRQKDKSVRTEEYNYITLTPLVPLNIMTRVNLMQKNTIAPPILKNNIIR